MSILKYNCPSSQATAEREFDLAIGRETQPYHSGACARDLPEETPHYREPIKRIVLGTVRIDLRTGKIVEDKERK